MKTSHLKVRTLAYMITAVTLVVVTVIFKIMASLMAEKIIYRITIIGDLLSTLDIIELFNIIVFAILGMGFGLAAALLPQKNRQKTSTILLVILVPLIFLISPMIKYHFWIEDVADTENISYTQSKSLTDSFLNHRIKLRGFLGYYIYTGNFPVIPSSRAEMIEAENLEKKVKSNFLSFNKITKIKPDILDGLLATGNWVIRGFYFVVSVLTTITHFYEGRQQLARIAQPSAPFFPAMPPRLKPSTNKPIPKRSQRKIPSR